MNESQNQLSHCELVGCGSNEHFNRRTLLKVAGFSGISWLTPVAHQLARAEEQNRRKRPRSLIILWLEGAASQLETFDPHPGTEIAAGSKARNTSVNTIQLGEGLEQTAELMEHFAIVRSVVSREGDHERAIYNVKTGYRPDPTLVHPAIGSVVCHHFRQKDQGVVDIPRHVSVLAASAPARGGFLGNEYDAFKIGDPLRPIPDVRAPVDDQRFQRRVDDLRKLNALSSRQFNAPHLDAALNMMSSEQLKAFDISSVAASERNAYGDAPFGRGCLAAVQLIEAGVRCVEVTLPGWDSHANNHQIQAERISVLDPAMAALIRDLQRRDLLDQTIVVCAGEFGRTPFMNIASGRDHWPHGFSIALAGGGIQGGRVIGETNPHPKRDSADRLQDIKNPQPIENVHASILHALGIDHEQEFSTPIGRPMPICEGDVIPELFA
ncbi:MAG TPA: DUF1501 domain-containing protein [Pirellulaceae bacterium]|nr:DUF1501 domain-containing protein [Pirellulaceae bacterium]HMP69629.1 DUF1501 domain-containing protein [Pirellulaceae bacterium]